MLWTPYGADVGAVNQNNRTPLHWTANVGSYHTVEVIIPRSATDDKVDIGGELAVLYAVREGHVELARMLMTRQINFLQLLNMKYVC